MSNFITFEGIEGSGKSTQIKLAAEYLIVRKVPVVVTQEPAGTDIGRKIADILFHRDHRHICAEAEMFLFCAARAQHVREVILPALHAQKVALCDRFSDATFAYQGAGRGLDPEFIRLASDYSAVHLMPGLTLLFDLPVEEGLRRATARNDRLEDPSAIDRFEREKVDFHRRIRESYLHLAKNDPGRFRLIDAARDVDAIQKDVRRHIIDFLKLAS